MDKGTDLGVRWSESEIHLHQLLAICSWADYLTSLCIFPSSVNECCCGVSIWNRYIKPLEQYSSQKEMSFSFLTIRTLWLPTFIFSFWQSGILGQNLSPVIAIDNTLHSKYLNSICFFSFSLRLFPNLYFCWYCLFIIKFYIFWWHNSNSLCKKEEKFM